LRTGVAPTLLGVALVFASACDRDEPVAAIEARATQALAQRDREALRDAVDALRSGADASPEAMLRAATWMRRAGQSAEAVWWLQDAVERHPDDVDLRVALGDAALAVGNPALARAAIAPIGPPSSLPLDALLVDARAELELGHLEPALALLESAARRNPNDPRAVAARVATLLREGQLERADAALREAAANGVDPATLLPLELLATRVLELQGSAADARARLESLASRHPGNATVLSALVAASLRDGAFEAARARVREGALAEPDLPTWSALEAQIALAQGDFASAESALRAFAAESESPGAHLLLASLRRQQAGESAAENALTAALERHPESTLLQFHRFESWIELDRHRDVARALPGFRTDSGRDAHADYLEARLALEDGRADVAAEQLRGVVPRLDRAYTQYWLGRALEARGELASAERRYALALTRDPRQVGPARALLRLADARADADAVASAAGAWASREPASVEANTTWITALVRAGAADAAALQAEALTRRLPEEPAYPALLAFALRAAGRLDDSEEVVETATARFGAHPALETERALGLAARGNLDAAIARLEATVAKHPGDASRHVQLAGLRYRQGDVKGAEREVDRALEIAPANLAPLALRARERARGGDDAAALADCDRFLAARPRHAGVLALRAHLLERAGRIDEAIEAYRGATALDAKAVAARNNLALLLAERGELPEARDLAQQAYALAEDEPEVVDTLGWIYWQSGLEDRAIALLEHAHRAAPTRPAPRLHLAIAYRDTGRASDARALLGGLSDDPDLDPALRREAHAALASLDD